MAVCLGDSALRMAQTLREKRTDAMAAAAPKPLDLTKTAPAAADALTSIGDSFRQLSNRFMEHFADEKQMDTVGSAPATAVELGDVQAALPTMIEEEPAPAPQAMNTSAPSSGVRESPRHIELTTWPLPFFSRGSL